MYAVVLYIHLLVLVTAFLAMGSTLNSLVQMRAGRTVSDVLRAVTVLIRTEKVMPVATVLLLATGAYMTHERWSWTTPWIDVSIAGLLLITAIGGAALGRRGQALERALREAQGQTIDAALAQHIANPFLFAGNGLNLGLVAGVMFVMVVKPAPVPGVLALVVGGFAGAFALGMAARQPRQISLDARSS